MVVRYDSIGRGYASQRIPDERWERQIHAALGAAAAVINVGAGTGNYEPTDRFVVALEPSQEMLAQRTENTAVSDLAVSDLAVSGIAVNGVAEALPFPDRSFDAALALLTVHHWTSQPEGLAELRRVADRQVITVFEQLVAHEFWLVDYFPEVRTQEVEVNAPTPEILAEHLNVVDVQTLFVPHDMTDGVAAAPWQRPEQYLLPEMQQSASLFALMPDDVRRQGTERLRVDLADGTWNEKYGYLLNETQIDAGYRLVIAEN